MQRHHIDIFKESGGKQTHDYSVKVKILPKNLRIGSGINNYTRWTLYQRHLYIRDNVVLNGGTFPVPWRLKYAEPYFQTTL